LPPSSYIICGTPRSGSTLLCQLLTQSGVAGSPHSYFREQDIGYWASCWDIDIRDTTSAAFNQAYLNAMEHHGRVDTGVFGVRIMWPSIATSVVRLNSALGTRLAFPEAFQERFGRTVHIHLRRDDTLSQAVSLVRAQQSGLWHLHDDGSILEGTDAPAPVSFDRMQLANTIGDLQRQERGWSTFFDEHGIVPLRLEYEEFTAQPRRHLARVLSWMGRDPAPAESATIPTAKMADDISRDWIARFRQGE
jgi:LPS sulfotransferase NodH